MNYHAAVSLFEGDRLTCFPYGVGHDAEGICLLIQLGPHRILLDCGLEDISPLVPALPVDLAICSHAHLDHSRGFWALHQQQPNLRICTSAVTAQLLPLYWPDRPEAEIQSFCQVLPWRSSLQVADDLKLEFFPAGHLPGAAAVVFTYTTEQRVYRLLYTGDFFLSNSRLVEGLPLESLRGLHPDVLIIEGTYGTARHSRRRQQEKQLMARIDRALSRNVSVLLPVPPIGVAQEILMLLRSHHQFTGRDLDIWVDGQVVDACDRYLQLLPHLPSAVQNFAKHQPLFWDEQVLPRMRRYPDKPQDLDRYPCVVLTDAFTEILRYCPPETGSWLVLLPDTPAPIADYLKIAERWQNSDRLHLDTYLLSQHSDGRNTTQLIHNIRPQHIIFVHGSPTYLADLTSLEELQNRYQLHSPHVGTLVELPIGDTFIQPEAPSLNHYEGEINELDSAVAFSFPREMSHDTRWQQFADTGLVEARWQGEELVIRGISQRELLSQSSTAKIDLDRDCCRNCLHQRGQRCWNRLSPLYGFKVTPDGYCPAFEADDGTAAESEL
ncbi:MAG: MBL fold metallo-hydrolase [Jaaginema sp. PMC 1079.18]|nr:MBL fold metallo-hydrolase [Jaaginema sp. PMC 1080.18]MEC4851531.1 MBL fold metallo-hydrolase [Jaaginema sp. PMC 1079.18]MEC4865759.1 MBL fold metallo-hydrolase [Jaaginema sp. PMC 1078.18]